MTTENQIKALAELDGWKQHPKYQDVMFNQYQEAHVLSDILSQYLTSYDAIIPLIQKRPTGIILQVWVRLECSTNCATLFQFTPYQLCEALLRATNRWKE